MGIVKIIIRFLSLFNRILFLFTLGSTLFFHPSLAEPQSPITMLNHRVIDAEYSKQLDRIVTVSATPKNQLHVINPLTGASAAVDLPLVPNCVSVGPNGLFAAVGHNAWISYINLSTPSLIKTLPVTTDVLDIVLAGNGWVYAFPRRDQWETIRCVNLQSGAEVQSGGYSIYAGTLAKLHPNGNAMYGADNGISPADIEKYDITQGMAVVLYDSPYHGDYAMCGNLWFSEDGFRIFTKCGNVFRSSQNRTEDMIYNGSLANIGSIVDLSHSTSAKKVLAIPGNTYGQPTNRDTEVWKYKYDYLSLESKIKLPAFSVNNQTYPSHGKFVFFNADGSRYSVVVQADASSGMLLDYGIYTVVPGNDQFVIDATAGLGGSITPSGEITVDGGSLIAFTIIPEPGYDVVDVLVDGVSVGKLTSYSFENVTGNHRIEALFTPLSGSSIAFLNHRVIDAEYSKQLDRIVTISATPLNQLHVINPLTGASAAVDLPLVPNCVSVGPDGLSAAVGHDAWISYVNLSTPSLIKTLPVTADVLDIVLAGNGWVYAFPRRDQWTTIKCINLESGEELSSWGFIYAGTLAKLHPNGKAMYGADNGVSPSDIEKYDISQGRAFVLNDSPYHGDYAMCGNLWISEDGFRIFTRCGNVFRSSENSAEDMVYNGSLRSGSIVDLSHSASANKVLAIPGIVYGTEIWKYDSTFLTFESKINLPTFFVHGQTYTSRGKFVFFNIDGTRYSVVVQADPNSGMLYDYGIFTLGTDIKQFFIHANAGSGGTITPSGTVVGYQGNNQSFTIAASTGYRISDVVVDGSSVGAVTTYQFTNLTADHTIAATFESTLDPETFWSVTIGNYWEYDGSDGSGGMWTREDEVTAKDSTTIPGVTTFKTDVYRDGAYEGSTWVSISRTELKEWREMIWDDVGYGPEWIAISFDDGLISAKNPFIVGDHWITTTTGKMAGSKGWSIPFTISLEVTVQAEESVTAPLDTYKAYRLQLILRVWNDQLGINQVATQYAWLVPYTGLVKSQDSSGATESLSGFNNQHIPLVPTNVSASDGTYVDRVEVTWAASSGATSYTVYRATSFVGSARKTVLGTIAGTLFSDITAIPKKTYYYWVKASNALGTSDFSSYDAGYRSDGSPSPTITVLSPNGGGNLEAGSTQTIQWAYTGNPGSYVKIELLQGGVVNRIIKSSAPKGSGGIGSCKWTIPANQAPGTDYRIRVTSISNGSYTDTSDNDFAIAAPTITVVSPNNGETWPAGSTQTVRWNYTGNPGSYVKIELLKGGVVDRIIRSFASKGTGGSGSCSWRIPFTQEPGSDYQIRVTSTSNHSYSDTSDSNFIISK